MTTEEYNALVKDLEATLLRNRDMEVLRLTQRVISLEAPKSHSHPVAVDEALEKRMKVLEKEQVNLRDYVNEELKALWEQIKPSPHERKPKSFWEFWR